MKTIFLTVLGVLFLPVSVHAVDPSSVSSGTMGHSHGAPQHLSGDADVKPVRSCEPSCHLTALKNHQKVMEESKPSDDGGGDPDVVDEGDVESSKDDLGDSVEGEDSIKK